MFGYLVVNQSDGREILVHDRAELAKSQGFDDVRRRNHTHHAGGGEAAHGNASRSWVGVLVENQRIGLQVRIHRTHSGFYPIKVP